MFDCSLMARRAARVIATTALAWSAVVHPQVIERLKTIEGDIAVEQRELALAQARDARRNFLAGGSVGVVPQVLAVHGLVGRMRASLDLGPGGVREVKVGDVVSPTMTVASIDVSTGVAVRVAGGKSNVTLPMKPAPALPSAGGVPTQAFGAPPGGGLAGAPGQGMTLVPPLLPVGQPGNVSVVAAPR